VENLELIFFFASTFQKYVVDYGNIAKQVFNLPDGTSVKLVIDKK
jgi:hypothetical protein